jgi:hypothetical protein
MEVMKCATGFADEFTQVPERRFALHMFYEKFMSVQYTDVAFALISALRVARSRFNRGWFS